MLARLEPRRRKERRFGNHDCAYCIYCNKSTDLSGHLSYSCFCDPHPSPHLYLLVAPQINQCFFNFVLPEGPPCTIPAAADIILTSPSFVFDGPLIVNCTGSVQPSIGICGGISVDCKGFSVTNIGSSDTSFIFGGDSVKNCDISGFDSAVIAPEGKEASVSNTKISGGRGLLIRSDNPVTVTLKNLEVTDSSSGIDFLSPDIRAVFDNVFSCGNGDYDVRLSSDSTVTKWDITCNEYVGFAGLDCPGTCPDAC
jgi:hypothetical protein